MSLEERRKSLELMQRIELRVAELMIEHKKATAHNERLALELSMRRLLDQMQILAQQLLKQQSLLDEEDCADEKNLTLEQESAKYYDKLRLLRDVHRRRPAADQMVKNLDMVEYEAVMRSCMLDSRVQFDGEDVEHGSSCLLSLFSGEECMGRYLDLVSLHQEFLNLHMSGTNQMAPMDCDYISYLKDFDNVPEGVPSTIRMDSKAYKKYLMNLTSYLKSFLQRAKPLVDQSAMFADDKVSDDSSTRSDLYCKACEKTFTNASVFECHFSGKKHQAAEKRLKEDGPGASIEQLEKQVNVLGSVLGEIRRDTIRNVERKQSRTFEERQQDAMAEQMASGVALEAGNNQDDDDEDLEDDRIYNPLNLPLDWDGKPIPYWLWKLHGLGVRFSCEICGNQVYMGRRAFDQHFGEWRHSNAMKALRIPNTRHFFQITKIDEAQALWEQLRKNMRRSEGQMRAEAIEECEDHLGNVYSRKTFEDLKRQGLL